MDGPAIQVVHHYISNLALYIREKNEDRTVWVEKVSVLNEEGHEASEFGTGETCSIIINLCSNVKEEGLSVAINFLDEHANSVFNTSSERMGHEAFSMLPGSSKSFRFDTHLHLVGGNFFLDVEVKKDRIQKVCDKLFPAATIFVKPQTGIMGIANLHPVLREI